MCVTGLHEKGVALIVSKEAASEGLEAMCRSAQTTFHILRPVQRSKCISLWTNLRIFNLSSPFCFMDPRHEDWLKGSSAKPRSLIAGPGTSYSSWGTRGRAEGYWDVIAWSEMHNAKSIPLEHCSGGPMLWPEWKGSRKSRKTVCVLYSIVSLFRFLLSS